MYGLIIYICLSINLCNVSYIIWWNESINCVGSFCASVYQFICLSIISQSIYLSVCIYLSIISLSIYHLSVYNMSISDYISFGQYLSFYHPSVYNMSISVYPFVGMYLSIHHQSIILLSIICLSVGLYLSNHH